MSRPSSFSRITPVFLALAVGLLCSLPAFAESQARIVRLSDVQGSVQINKLSGLGFEAAFVNLPITQGVQLRTGANGRAEIEFEDGSSMRLTPYTTVEFSRLDVDDSGQRSSEVHLLEGMAYVDWLGKDPFSLRFKQEAASPDHAAHFRVDTSNEAANLAVFKGEVDIDGPNGKTVVDKKKTATFAADDDAKPTIAGKITEAPLDAWDHQASAYHDQYAKNNANGYGASDLNYYGSYSNIPGYGMMWQPFFTGIGWDPFMDGAWSWYPGFGYMYASAYPWGWLPYMYGNWAYAPGYGWGWQPGPINRWHPIPHYTPTTLAHVSLAAPVAGVKTVVLGRGGALSPLSSSHMVVRAGSAGMGIPRGSLTGLKQMNHQVAKSGFVAIHAAPQFAASSPTRSLGGSAPAMPSGSFAHSAAPVGHSSSGGGSHH